MQQIEAPANPLVAALLAGAAPRQLKISAARGVLPVARTELLKILVVLVQDGDEEVRREAGKRLTSFPQGEIRPLLADPEAPPEVLHHFASDPGCLPALREILVANPATPAATLRGMISSFTSSQVDLMLLNQTRLIANPDLLDLIDSGDLTLSPLQRSRIEEIRHHFLRAPAAAAPAAVRPERAPEPVKAAPPPPPAVEAQATATPAPGPASEPDDALIANATSKILKMNTADKVQLAMKGTREERAILIKDSSKMVQEAVLDSPKLTENEVEGISKMRSVSEDVLRIVAGSRDWMKNYTICHSLALNPKTPAGIAMNLVTRLTNHDLKLLVGDKNVSEVIRRQAKRIIEGRNQRSGHH
ncbi:MAG TPA: hypothetical protein VGK94_10650 [Candidatus Polarisedimenticolia bacterium]|jgi:pyruvate/2-oxoglutarate dehydrogenase complex dihydrolipoamide acyltransferase (E2) component